MFQKMGPAPKARFGHAMAANGSCVFVLGGLSATSLDPTNAEDPSIIHVLNTSEFYAVHRYVTGIKSIILRVYQIPGSPKATCRPTRSVRRSGGHRSTKFVQPSRSSQLPEHSTLRPSVYELRRCGSSMPF